MIPFRANAPRPDEQIVGGFIPVVWAGKEVSLPVLSIRENRGWSAQFAGSIRKRLDDVGPLASIDEVVALLMASMDTMVDLLLAYDRDKLLGEREWIDEKVSDREVYEALKRVTAAAFPFGVDLKVLVPELMPVLMQSLSKGIATAAVTMASSQRTSGPPPSTGGRRKRSRRGSQTSN